MYKKLSYNVVYECYMYTQVSDVWNMNSWCILNDGHLKFVRHGSVYLVVLTTLYAIPITYIDTFFINQGGKFEILGLQKLTN